MINAPVTHPAQGSVDPAVEPPLITLSVVSHGQRALVENLVADLVRLQPRGVAKLILTINRPEDPPAGLAALPFETVILRNERARGFGANHNRAFRECATPWFAILNPDLHLVSDFFAASVRNAADAVALVAPSIVESTGVPADSSRRLLTPWQLVLRVLGNRVPAGGDEVDWLAGMCMLVRSRAFADVGGFDERFFLYLEDADLCLRLRLAGWSIRQTPEAQVVHAAQRASHRSFRYLRWHVASLLKHWLSPAFWRYLQVRGAAWR